MSKIFIINGVLRRSSFFKVLNLLYPSDTAQMVRITVPAPAVFSVILSVFLFAGQKLPGQSASGNASRIFATELNVAGVGIETGSLKGFKPEQKFIETRDKKSRLWLVAGTHAVIWAGTFVALNHAWYRDYPKSSFHFFDDRKEWKQMDKAGHVWTTYQLSRHSAASWKWAGMNERQSAWFGGASAFAFQSIIEILDGFSEEWGFSVGDMEANLVGAGGYVAQQLLFKEQLIQVKFGYRPYDYPDDLKPRRDHLFGKSLPEQLLKDYNSQRYWLSGNLKSISGSEKLPAWLNLAVGYSADALYGANSNIWTDKQGNHFDRSTIDRVRRFYLSPDIDLTKIRTKSKFLRSVFFIVNMVKIPAPALEFNSKGKLKFHAVLF